MARPTTPVLNKQSIKSTPEKHPGFLTKSERAFKCAPRHPTTIHCEHFWFQKLSDSSWHKTSFQRIDSTVLCQLWAVWRTEHYHGNPISIDTWAKLVEDSIGLSLGWRWMLLDWDFSWDSKEWLENKYLTIKICACEMKGWSAFHAMMKVNWHKQHIVR